MFMICLCSWLSERHIDPKDRDHNNKWRLIRSPRGGTEVERESSARLVGEGVNPPLVSLDPQVFIDPRWFSQKHQKYIADPPGFTINRVLRESQRYIYNISTESRHARVWPTGLGLSCAGPCQKNFPKYISTQ